MNNTPEEMFYLNKCCQLIEEKLGWGKAQEWTNYNFEQLSINIKNVSSTHISTDTLKRLFGKKKHSQHYNPQLATKNALALFLSYRNWSDFKTSNPYLGSMCNPESIDATPKVSEDAAYREEDNYEISGKLHEAETLDVETFVDLPSQVSATSTTGKSADYSSKAPIVILAAVLILLVGIAGLYYYYQRPSVEQAVKFEARYLAGNVPHTAAFHYDISRIQADTVFIRYANKRYLLSKTDSVFMAYFAMPGYYTVELATIGQVLYTAHVYVLTKGWQCIVNENYHLSKNINLFQEPGVLHVPQDEIGLLGIKKDQEYFVWYSNARDFNASADNYTLQTRIKNDPKQGGVSCFDSEIVVVGEKDNTSLKLVDVGCFRWAHLKFGNIRLNGEKSDLSAFSHNLSDWQEVRIQVKNKHVTVSVGGKQIYTGRYDTEIGKIKGISYIFKGCGSVDFIKVYNQADQLVYSDDFGA